MSGGIVSCLAAVCAALGLGACAVVAPPDPPLPAVEAEAQYAALFPDYAEICALSQLGKKPGFGADLMSGIGGHAVMYLNGVCRRQDSAYPELIQCDGARSDGVGISVNAHYKNADWVAIPGRDFFFEGGLPPGTALTKETYRTVQEEARSRGLYGDVTFQDDAYDGMPPDFNRDSYRYEISVATDYAIAFGRNRYCARVPLSHGQTKKIVDYLNALNEPYRTGRKEFEWSVLSHNCSHVNHDALSAAGLWTDWPMDRLFLISMFDFPVPKNEFVNLMRRTNDFPIDDLDAVFADKAARALLHDERRLPTQPGALVDLGFVFSPNEVYDTKSQIIFYDDPVTGSYQGRFETMLREPRYFRLVDNLRHFAELYRRIAAERLPVEWHLARHPDFSPADAADFRLFYREYYDYIDAQIQETGRNLALLDTKNPAAMTGSGPS